MGGMRLIKYYGSLTVRQKTVRFVLRTVSRTYGPLGVLFGRQPRKHLGRDLLWISYVFLLCFTVLLKQSQRLYTGGFIFQVPPVYNYSTCCTSRVLTRLRV